MSFPISRAGAVTVPNVSVEHAVARLERALADAKPWWLRRKGSTFELRGGLFRLVWSWNALVPITRGEVEVVPIAGGVRIRYRVTFTELLVVVTVAVTAFFGPPLVSAPNLSTGGALGVLALFWCFLFGGNYSLACFSLPRFLRRAVSPPYPDAFAA